ncbi:hypothetical protein [Comamonas fluminis]|uniref:hypothetical protein n=1 Tax=Comamonas fluminis TaxID=2796366 RepID=UPI001C443BA9|nr:hypothetical protein [Comamonas fluminis]
MKIKEYLSLFDGGICKVKVKFKNNAGQVAEMAMAPEELIKIVKPNGEGFEDEMNFDEWKFKVEKYEIFPRKNLLIIHAYQ